VPAARGARQRESARGGRRRSRGGEAIDEASERLRVDVGTTVAWHNDDAAPHAIAFADGAPASDLLLPGQGFARTFTQAGRFDYACSVHPYMRGTVTVGP
jgi:plastocyanin